MAKRDLFTNRALISLLLVVILAQNAIVQAKKIKVDVFYSPMDPKSGEFIKESVAQMSKEMLSDFVNLNMYPVAGCKYEDSKLVCDGGDAESNASLMHACAFDTLSPETAGERDATDGLKYIACTMNPPKVDLDACEVQLKDVKSKVEKCVSEQAIIPDIMSKYKQFTVDYKPFVAIDGKQTKMQDQAAVKAWMITVCKALSGNAPKECSSSPDFKRADPPAEAGKPDAGKPDKGGDGAAAGGDGGAAGGDAGGEGGDADGGGGNATGTTKAGVERYMAPAIGSLMVFSLGLAAL